MDEFDAQWFRPRRVKTKKRKARLNPSSLAGGIEEIPEMLGKKRLAAEDRPMEERMTREQAENLAQKLETWLVPYVEFAEVCGSYRRGREDPGDLDVVVILKNRVKLPEVVEMWLAEGKASAVNWVGEKKTQMVIDGVKVDIRTTTPRAKGAALLYFTGPAGYNIGIRSAAKRAGFKLSEYGLFNRETNEYIAGATEEDIYAALGRNYRAPTERRAEEKISLAQRLNRERPKPKGQDYSLLTQEQLTGIGGYFFNTKEKRQAFRKTKSNRFRMDWPCREF
jgi:predicted nucleotidyltransferase